MATSVSIIVFVCTQIFVEVCFRHMMGIGDEVKPMGFKVLLFA